MTGSEAGTPTNRRHGEHPGPPPAALATGFALAVLASLAVPAAFGNGVTPMPSASDRSLGEYVAATTAVTTSGGLQLLAGVLLVAFGAVVSSRLAFLAPNAPGPSLAGVGSVGAGLAIATSGLAAAGAARLDDLGHADLVPALLWLGFLAGGAAHVALLGVAVLGIAVTMLFVARTPRWLALAGVGLAVLDLGTILTVPLYSWSLLLVPGRFLSMAWLIAAAALLPRRRGPRGAVS